jgi:hypothetical protein
MTETQTIIQRQDPAIEAYRLGLLGDVQAFIRQRIADGTMPPDYQVAQMAPGEQAAVAATQAGIGAYQPFLSAGSEAIGLGQGQLMGGASPAFQAGIGALSGTGEMFSPTQTAAFMNPFEEAVIQQSMQDIQRQGDIAQQGVRAQAVGSGAFGGSRQAVAEQELQRNILEQQARTAAQLRAGGFTQAQDVARQAFEASQGRRQQAAGIYGNLGAGIGSLGGQLGQLGIQQAGIGELQSRLGAQDIQNLMATGGLERGVQQATLDAQRMSNLQRFSQPYQQYGFLSDIYSGVPTGQMTTTSSSAPQVSPFQTALGLGVQGITAVAGANRAGLI